MLERAESAAEDQPVRRFRVAESSERPVLEIIGGPGGVSWRSFHELWVFREVLWAFLIRQVKVKYKQAVVGVGWAVVQPVLSAAVFAIFLGHVANVASENAPYLLFALAGMVVWSYFAGATSGGMESLVIDSQLLRKVYFPREVLPLAAVGAALVDLVPGLVTLIVAALLYGNMPSVTWLSLIFPVVIVVLAATALSIGLSAINVYYRDVRYALPFLLSVGLFASPTVYSLTQIPASWRTWYAIGNPVAGAIDSMRRPILHDQWPEPRVVVGALLWSAVLFVLSYVLFKRLERGFSDRI